MQAVMNKKESSKAINGKGAAIIELIKDLDQAIWMLKELALSSMFCGASCGEQSQDLERHLKRQDQMSGTIIVLKLGIVPKTEESDHGTK